MKTFLINLDRNPDRLAFMKRQLDDLGLPFERVAAVDGRKIVLRHCLRELLVEQRWLAAGEIGCAMSHLSVYARMRDEGVAQAVVLEDDVRLSPDLSRILGQVGEFLREDRPQVVLLNAHGCSAVRKEGVERIWSGLCTDGYVLNRAAAELILRLNSPVVCPADGWKRWVVRGGLELYRAWPTTVTQDKERFPMSDVLQEHEILHGARLFIHRTVKAFCLTVDWGWWKVSGK